MLVKRLAAYTHLSSTISEIYQVVIGRKLRHCHTPWHIRLATPQGVMPSEFREDLVYTQN